MSVVNTPSMVEAPENKKNLIEILQETNLVVQSIIANGGEIPEELEVQLTKNETQLSAKVDAYAYVMERMKLEEGYWKEKAREFDRIAKSIKRVGEEIKGRMVYAMETMGLDEIKGDDFRFKLTKGPGSLDIFNEEVLPDEYVRTTIVRDPQKNEIKAALKAGEKIPGCELHETKVFRKYANKKGVTDGK